MTDRLRSTAEAVALAKQRLAAAQGDRDAAVRDALGDGMAAAKIAAAAGLTPMRVYQIRDRTR